MEKAIRKPLFPASQELLVAKEGRNRDLFSGIVMNTWDKSLARLSATDLCNQHRSIEVSLHQLKIWSFG